MSYRKFTKGLREVFRSQLLQNYVGRAHARMGTKIKNDGTPVTDLDNSSLLMLRSYITSCFPEDIVLGEEDKKSEVQIKEILSCRDQFQWTVDGLDGTGNYRMGTNSYGAAIARRRGDLIPYSVTFLPVDEVLRGNGFYYAEHGKGAWQWCATHRKYHKLSTAPEGTLERMVIMLEGSSKKFFRSPISNLGTAVTTRSSFSSCVASIAVASGKASALLTIQNKPWDNWPSWLMIQEAGGVVTDWLGNSLTPHNCGEMVGAANRADHTAILALLNPKLSHGQ